MHLLERATLRLVQRCSLLAALVVLSACATMSPRTQPLALSAATAGTAASDAADSAYEALAGLKEREYQQAKLGALLAWPSDSEPRQIYTDLGTPPKPEAGEADKWADAIAARRRAVKSMSEAYTAFQSLASSTAAADTSDAIGSLREAEKALAEARSKPLKSSVIPNPADKIAEAVITGVQAKKLKTHNAALAELVERMHELWQLDMPVWEETARIAFGGLARATLSLPDNRFDAASIAKVVEEPLSSPLRLRMYKARLLEKSAAERQALLTQLSAVGKSFTSLEKAHLELAKDKPSFDDTITYLNRAMAFADAASEGDNQ